MPLVVGTDTAQRFEVMFAKMAGRAHPSLYCLYLGYAASREVVDSRWKLDSSLTELRNDVTNIGLTV